MAFDNIQQRYKIEDNDFFKNHYHQVIWGLMLLLVVIMIAIGVVLYQIINRPLPQFNAKQPDGQTMLLIPFDQPNLLPNTILRWASKAATVAYTFDFVRYKEQVAAARPYFTEDGWQDYLGSVQELLSSIVEGQLFVNGVVSGPPVISNQGILPGKGEAWRVQIPFLVTYQGGNNIKTKPFYVILSIVRVPTSTNKQAIGIDQFVMV
jgi:intracellular multiplication protein IcmL